MIFFPIIEVYCYYYYLFDPYIIINIVTDVLS